MYRFYNNNKLGLYEDDCTVRAISLAENDTWDNTYDKLSDLAQERGTMMDKREFIIDYLDERYPRLLFDPKTVGEVSGENPDKTLLITMPGHITCSLCGIVLDSYDCRDRQAEYAWVIPGRRKK
jgi:hypothetical protein